MSRTTVALLGAVILAAAAAVVLTDVSLGSAHPTRLVGVSFRGPGGYEDRMVVSMPAWYGPGRDPALPLVISPHSRGATALENARRWGDVPGRFGLLVLSPQLHGRVIPRRSFAWPPDVAELGRLPVIARRLIPYLRYDRSRVYALGHSMGGQEALMLLARRPGLLAAVVAADPVTNFLRRWYQFPASAVSRGEQRAAATEVGATPRRAPWLYLARSPLFFARSIACAGVPTQLWWNPGDSVVIREAATQAGALYRAVRRLNPRAPIYDRLHHHEHGWVFKYDHELPQMVRFLLAHRRAVAPRRASAAGGGVTRLPARAPARCPA
jgi:pimeloyl-ACP methyl ester carboxylesterase